MLKRLIPRFRVVEFGSTLLGSHCADSDLDLLVSSFDCLLDQDSFFDGIKEKLITNKGISEVSVVRSANIPLVKFKYVGIKVDISFVNMITPAFIYSEVASSKGLFVITDDYLLSPTNVNSSNQKGLSCLRGYET